MDPLYQEVRVIWVERYGAESKWLNGSDPILKHAPVPICEDDRGLENSKRGETHR